MAWQDNNDKTGYCPAVPASDAVILNNSGFGSPKPLKSVQIIEETLKSKSRQDTGKGL